MKTFIDYLALAERTYCYRVKTIVALDDVKTTAIENAIVKYDPLDITITKTILQDAPLDFINVPPSEVYIVDLTLGLPASQLSLRMEICAALACADKFVVVRGQNDPIENETQAIIARNAIAAEAEKAGLTPEALLNDPAYKEAEEFVASDMYGDAFNSKFVSHLKKIADDRVAAEAAKIAAIKPPMFSFLAPIAAAAENYNADISTPPAKGDEAALDDHRSMHGNFDGDKKQYRRVFRTKTGQEKVVVKDADGVRKGA